MDKLTKVPRVVSEKSEWGAPAEFSLPRTDWIRWTLVLTDARHLLFRPFWDHIPDKRGVRRTNTLHLASLLINKIPSSN